MPKMTLEATYPMNPHVFPVWSILRLSLAKVEKVVKPPQTPVVISKHQLLTVSENLENRPYNNPIKRQPRRLTERVPQGNPVLIPFMAAEIRYRTAPPMKLPEPTRSIAFIISDSFQCQTYSRVRRRAILKRLSALTLWSPPFSKTNCSPAFSEYSFPS